MCLSILQAGIDRRVLLNAVDINGRFNLNASSNAILKFQQVDGSTLYDSLEVSSNVVENTSILNANNIGIPSYLQLKASAPTVYTNQKINDTYVSYINSFTTKAGTTGTYLKTDVDVLLSMLQAGIDRRALINAVDINGRFKLTATSNAILKSQKVDGSTLYDSLQFSLNDVDDTISLKVRNIDI